MPRAPAGEPRGAADSQRDVGTRPDGDRHPEVQEAPAEDGESADLERDPEAAQHERDGGLDEAEAGGGDGDRGEDVADPVRDVEDDGVDVDAERGEKAPQRGRVEEPVDRRPQRRPLQTFPVARQLSQCLADVADDVLELVGGDPWQAPTEAAHRGGPPPPLRG